MLTKGDKIIAGTGTITPLLTSIWSDHILNDISWLRADTFSWQSGDVYTAAYQHLLADIDGKELQSETIGDITIEFYLADDGHKITTDEEKVASIYTATAVAWYYVIDTANRRFKLPRTKFGFTGIRDRVGDYVEPGLPDHRHSLVTKNQTMPWAGNSGVVWYAEKTGYTGYASDDNPIYGNSNTVQPPATQMYLYFYVGQFTQTAIEQTAGITTEVMGTKVDKGHEVVEYWRDGVNYYRVYADGFCEQYIYKTIGSTTIAAHTGVDITNKGLNLYKPMDIMRGVACVSGYSCVLAGDPFHNTTTTVGLWIYNASDGSVTSNLSVGIWLQGRAAK